LGNNKENNIFNGIAANKPNKNGKSTIDKILELNDIAN